jgi:hypothetical protein
VKVEDLLYVITCPTRRLLLCCHGAELRKEGMVRFTCLTFTSCALPNMVAFLLPMLPMLALLERLPVDLSMTITVYYQKGINSSRIAY